VVCLAGVRFLVVHAVKPFRVMTHDAHVTVTGDSFGPVADSSILDSFGLNMTHQTNAVSGNDCTPIRVTPSRKRASVRRDLWFRLIAELWRVHGVRLVRVWKAVAVSLVIGVLFAR
jgi:hypothetical protein